MKTAVITVLLTGLCATLGFTAEGKGDPQNFEAKKAKVLKHIEQRIAHNTEEKACVQAAASHEALKACREKFRSEMKDDRKGRRQ